MELWCTPCLILVVFVHLITTPSFAAFNDDNDHLITNELDVDDPLCDCYDIRLNEVTRGSSDTLCYHYSVKYNIEDIQCSKDAVSIILGVCEADEHPFTHHSLDHAVLSVRPDQYAFAPYPSSSESHADSIFGLRIKNLISSWMNEEVIVCMDQHTISTDSPLSIDYGTTSHSVQYLMNDNSMVTCRDHPNLVGLPCKSYQAQKPSVDDTTFGLDNDMDTVPSVGPDDEWIPKHPVEPIELVNNEHDHNHSIPAVPTSNITLFDDNHLPFDRIPIPELIRNTVPGEVSGEVTEVLIDSTGPTSDLSNSTADGDGSVESNNNLLLEGLVDSEADIPTVPNTAFSLQTRGYIRYGFVFIMIFIGLNVLFCTFMALRQSGALDAYFEKPATGDSEDEMSPLDLEDGTEESTEYISEDFEESEHDGYSSIHGDEVEGDTTEREDEDEEEEEEDFDPLSDANLTPIAPNGTPQGGTPHGAHESAISIIDFGAMVDHVHRKEMSQSVPEMDDIDHHHCRSEPAMFSQLDAGSIASLAHTFHD